MEINVSAGQLKDRKADDRGRINLGTEYADMDVVVAVVEPEEPEEIQE
jgi:hypothetical protein